MPTNKSKRIAAQQQKAAQGDAPKATPQTNPPKQRQAAKARAAQSKAENALRQACKDLTSAEINKIIADIAKIKEPAPKEDDNNASLGRPAQVVGKKGQEISDLI